MATPELNLPQNLAPPVHTGPVAWHWPLLLVLSRTILFLCTGLAIVASMTAAGWSSPGAGYLPWWPYQVIVINVLIYVLVSHLARREGLEMESPIGYQTSRLRRDVWQAALLMIPGTLAGVVGLYGVSGLIWGTMPAETVLQPLPLVAASIAAVAFPLTHVIMEATTHRGYSLPWLEALLQSRWAPLLLVAVGLLLQQVPFPLVLDWQSVLWRLVSLLPLALFVGFVYLRLRRLVPVMLVHFLMDLQLGVTLVLVALPK